MISSVCLNLISSVCTNKQPDLGSTKPTLVVYIRCIPWSTPSNHDSSIQGNHVDLRKRSRHEQATDEGQRTGELTNEQERQLARNCVENRVLYVIMEIKNHINCRFSIVVFQLSIFNCRCLSPHLHPPHPLPSEHPFQRDLHPPCPHHTCTSLWNRPPRVWCRSAAKTNSEIDKIGVLECITEEKGGKQLEKKKQLKKKNN